jgi:hypothetical protein
MQSQKVINAMEKFVEEMFSIYSAAEGLRDCTDLHEEKAIFNRTRGALYDLQYDARALLKKWQLEASKQNHGNI